MPAIVARLISHMGPTPGGSTAERSDVMFVAEFRNCYLRFMYPHFDLTAALNANDAWRISAPA